MPSNAKQRLLKWLGMARFKPAMSAETRQARALIAAIDAGGIPLNPAKVNEIARNLGLEVSRKAPVEETIRRIRAALERAV
jgi:hypothetical protein